MRPLYVRDGDDGGGLEHGHGPVAERLSDRVYRGKGKEDQKSAVALV